MSFSLFFLLWAATSGVRVAIHHFEDFPALVSSPVFLNDKSTRSLPEELSPTKKVQESYQHKVGQFYNGKKSIHAGGGLSHTCI